MDKALSVWESNIKASNKIIGDGNVISSKPNPQPAPKPDSLPSTKINPQPAPKPDSLPSTKINSQPTPKPDSLSSTKININLSIGQKYFNSDSWEELNKQIEKGIEADFRLQNWPIGFVLAWLTSNKEAIKYDPTSGNVNIEGKTDEYQAGIKKYFNSSLMNIYLYIEGGLVYVETKMKEGAPKGITKSYFDNAIGSWIGVGTYWPFYNPFHIGLESKYSFAKLALDAADVNAGGWHFDSFIGVHW